MTTLHDQGPAVDPDVVDTEPVDIDHTPPDPTIEQPPADIDHCTRCAGHGTVFVDYDPDTGRAIDDDCPRCQGTGVEYGWLIGGAA